MSSELFRKYIDMINEAGEVPTAASQQDLAQLYAKAKPMSFIKNTPVALVPFPNLEKMFGPAKAQEIAGLAGAVDKTSYEDMHGKFSIIFDMFSNHYKLNYKKFYEENFHKL